jgi:quinol-cytochrome oxidoreductase complex cytochrome b subunit
MTATLIGALVLAIIIVALLSRTNGRWGSQPIQYARALRRDDIPERGEPLNPRRPRDLAVLVMIVLIFVGAVVAIVIASR